MAHRGVPRLIEHTLIDENAARRRQILKDVGAQSAARGGQPLTLTTKEYVLLEYLARNAGRVVTRTMFLESVWNFHFDPQTNIVESHLSRMRAKLNEGFDRDPIETVRGVGYLMAEEKSPG